MALAEKKPLELRWLVVTALAALALLFLIPFIRQGGARVDTSVEVETEKAVIGDIREITTGSARVVGMEHWDQSAPFAGVLAEWKVGEGELVKTGDVVAVYDAASLNAQIEETLSEIESLDESMQTLGQQVDFSLTAPASGVVRTVTAQRGDGTDSGVLAVLSTDGRWMVRFSCEGETLPEEGSFVSLFSSSRRYEGTVEQVEEGEVTVTFADDGSVTLGEAMDVLDRSGERIGTGAVEISAPVEIASDRTGIVTSVSCRPGDQVEEGDALIRCIDVSLQDNCEELVTQRRAAAELLVRLRAFRAQPEVAADHDGVVSDFAASDRLEAGNMLFRITSQDSYQVTVTAPLRDADRIRQGQQVVLHFGESVCQGQVVRDVGQNQRAGVTCTVSVTMVDNRSHQVLDEADATIVLAQRKGVVLIPAKSVSLAEDGSETVNVAYGDGLTHAVHIVTGLNNGTQVEVLQGLSEGDEVVISSRIVETTFYSLFNHEWVVGQREGPAGDGLVTEEPTDAAVTEG